MTAATTLLGIGPTGAGAATFGLSDQSAQHLRDSRVAASNLAVVRLIVPWDVAFHSSPDVDDWLGAAAALPATAMVVFERNTGARCPDAPCEAPSVADYREAFAAFRERWPAVREFAPWNEPNHPWQPTADDPARAAAFHDALRRDCAACTIVAGEFVDSASMKGYFASYRAALTEPVQVWGIHNYGDLVYDRASYVSWLLARTSEPLWLTETGGIVALRSVVDGSVQLPANETRANASMGRLLDLLTAEPSRIQRAYAYHWQQQIGAAFDAGLTRADGTLRPSGKLFLEAAGQRPAATPSTPTPAGPSQGAPGANGDGVLTDLGTRGTTPSTGSTGASAFGPPGGDATSAPTGASAASASPAASAAARRLGRVARGAHVASASRGTGPRIGTPRRHRGGWRVPVRCPRQRARGCTATIVLTAPRRTRAGITVVARRTIVLPNARWHRVLVPRRALVRRPPTAGAIAVTRPTRVAARDWFALESR